MYELIYDKEPNLEGLNIRNSTVWENSSLPLGNGYFGASYFGYINKDRIQITENSLANPYDWNSATPKYNFGLMSFCDIFIEFNNEEFSDYKKVLSLDNSLIILSYTQNNVNFKRELFTSYQDKILAVKLSSSKDKSLNLKVSLEIPFLGELKSDKKSYLRTGKVDTCDDTIILSGNLDHYDIDYAAILKVTTKDGCLRSENNKLIITDSSEVILYFTCGTNYKLNKNIFLENDPKKKLQKDKNLLKNLSKRILKASKLGYEKLYINHLNDYSKLFNNVKLVINNESANSYTVPELIRKYKNGEHSSYLESLLFEYGRYLLICSSRENALPANLQGIWSCYESSPWSCGYWHNINVQMNYWPIGPANMLEMFKSYSDYAIAYFEKAKQNASEYIKEVYPNKYDKKNNGWIVGTGAWPYLIEGIKDKSHSGPGTGGFTSLLFYEYYKFSGDKKYLKNVAYPFLYDMSIFLEKTLIKVGDAYLVEKSASPENTNTKDGEWNDYHFTTGCAFDQQMVYENFKATLEAAKVLKITKDPFLNKLEEYLSKLEPVLIGESGQIKEYREEHQYAEFGEPNHRHISQLVGLYPGTVINKDNKEFLDASIYTLNQRGDKSTGWALMHRLCLWSRTGVGSRAYDIIKSFISNNVLDNLFDSHPPFQIDGNFGYVAGVSEMLLQSQNGYIEILPTCPNEWNEVSVKGLLARGNFVVSYKLEKDKRIHVEICSKNGGELKVLNNFDKENKNHLIVVNTNKNQVIKFDGELII